jgi:hypothetical protein
MSAKGQNQTPTPLTLAIAEPIAVARLTQGISPKRCTLARLPGEGLLAKCLSLSLSSGCGTGFRAFDNRPVSCRVQPSVVSTPKEMRYVLR